MIFSDNHQAHKKTANNSYIPFGLMLENEKLYEPSRVPNGDACGLVCPSCKQPLVAKANEDGKEYKVIPHFAHKPDSNCEHARESAIHMAAKQLIEERLELFLPAIEARVEEYDVKGILQKLSTPIRQAGNFKLQSVRLEESVGDFRPDIIATDENGIEFFIEIAVTSFVGQEKLEKIKHLGQPLVEINASEVPIDNFEQLAQLLFNPADMSKIKWKYHPEIIKEELLLTAELNLLLEDIANKVRKEDELQRWRQQRAEANRRYEQEKEKQRLAEIEKDRLEKATRFKESSEGNKLTVFLKFLEIEENKIPWFLDYKVRGENSFGVTRKTWQLSIFGVFIQRSERRKNEHFNLEDIAIWVGERFVVSQKFHNSNKIAIWDFLDNLSQIGVLEHMGKQKFEIREDNLKYLIARKIPYPVNVSKIHSNNVEWATEWPNAEFIAPVVLKYKRKHGLVCDWERIKGLFPKAREKSVNEVVIRYLPAGREDLKKMVLAFMFEAGFIRVKRR